jgi:geranylgeranyl diphosphate synthase, type II
MINENREQLFNNFLSALEEYRKKLNGIPKELYEPQSYILSLGGKRMRPLMVLMGCELFGQPAKKAINAALAIEVFHNFSLIHDDIMDNAPLRRGKLTVHEKWNSNIAILSGDAMLVEAYKLIADYDAILIKKLLPVFNKTAVEVCEGQQLDMNFETQQCSLDDYIRMITLKTAVLLGASFQMGAIIADASNEDCNNIYEFGLQTGIAFQLMDDLLDTYGDAEKFGKKPGGDILAAKKTYLFLKTLELAVPEDKLKLENLYRDKTELPEQEKISQVISLFNKYQVKELLEKEMQIYFKRGISSLNQIHAADQKKLELKEFAESLMYRES